MAARIPPVQYVSCSDAARILRVNLNTLYRAIRSNEIPHVEVGGGYVIPLEFLGVTPEPIVVGIGKEAVGQLLLDLRW